MNTLAAAEVPGPEAPSLSPKAIFGIVVLAAFTILMTWRAGVLESSLARVSEEPELVHQMAPDFSVATLDGRTVSLGDFRGQKKVVVAFWASWCGPCRLEMPTLVKFYQKNHSASSDFEILAVSIDQDRQDVANFAAGQHLNFPVLLDSNQRLADAYHVDGIPTMFVIDKDGKIIFGHVGYSGATQYQLPLELGIKPKVQGEGTD